MADKCLTNRATEDAQYTSIEKDNGSSLSPEEKNKLPQRLIKKFEDLKKRRQEICKRSTEKRVKQLQDNILKKVEEEFTSQEDLEVLRENDVVLPGSSSRKRKCDDTSAKQEGQETDSKSGEIFPVPIKAAENAEDENKWKDVQRYLGCNDHIKGTDKGKYAPKTKLHIEIEEAVASGDYEKAEKLSDDLATREFGTKIAEAFDAKKYAEVKQDQEDVARTKRKKKLHWGFEHKHRWETKSNM